MSLTLDTEHTPYACKLTLNINSDRVIDIINNVLCLMYIILKTFYTKLSTIDNQK